MEDAQLLRIGHVAVSFYRQVEPEQRHFEIWTQTLKEPMRSFLLKKGFEACKGMLNFRRFVAELNDTRLKEHMKTNLSPEDYWYWQKQTK